MFMSQFSIKNQMIWLIDWRNAQISSLPQSGIIHCGRVAGTVAVTHAALSCLTAASPLQGINYLSCALTHKVLGMIWPSHDLGSVNRFESRAKESFCAFFRGMELCTRNLVQRKVPTDCSLTSRIIGSRPSPLERLIADIIEKPMYSFTQKQYKKLLRDMFPDDERFIEKCGEILIQEIINPQQISRFHNKDIRKKLEADHLEWERKNKCTYWIEWLAPFQRPQFEQRPPNVGFVYQLTIDAKIVGYLVGTIHLLPTWMLTHKRMLDALDHSAEFISEVGDQALTETPWKKCKKIVVMDLELTSEAKTRGIPIHALETEAEQLTALNKVGLEKISVKDDLKEIPKLEEDLLNSDLLSQYQNLWHQGAEEKLIGFGANVGPAASQILVSERNHTWTEGENGLVARLQRASAPICIAVGASHLFRDDGLLAIFRNNGIQAKHLT
jgi:uncharacterized protein YbaP (TraB family)